jgi:hypothetical protein
MGDDGGVGGLALKVKSTAKWDGNQEGKWRKWRCKDMLDTDCPWTRKKC